MLHNKCMHYVCMYVCTMYERLNTVCYMCIRTYVKASRVLEQYQHMPSFSGIHHDCQGIVARLKIELKKRLDDPNVSAVLQRSWN